MPYSSKPTGTLSQKLLFTALRHRTFCANFAVGKNIIRFKTLVPGYIYLSLCGSVSWVGRWKIPRYCVCNKVLQTDAGFWAYIMRTDRAKAHSALRNGSDFNQEQCPLGHCSTRSSYEHQHTEQRTADEQNRKACNCAVPEHVCRRI